MSDPIGQPADGFLKSEIRNHPSEIRYSPWLHRFALLFVLATLVLVVLGGTVTSKGAGLAVPDWPTTFDHHMFLFPPSMWVGGIFWEHLHRLMGSLVGLLAIINAIWLWHAYAPVDDLSAAQSPRTAVRGIPGESPRTAVRGIPGESPRTAVRGTWLRWFGIATLIMVIAQGIMGGLRVTQLSTGLAVFHGVTAQVFFCMTVLTAAATSRWWSRCPESRVLSPESARQPSAISHQPSAVSGQQYSISNQQSAINSRSLLTLRVPCFTLLAVLFIQLALGATMRHYGAGLAIPDFPASYGGVVPPLTHDGIDAAMADFAADPAAWSRNDLHQTYTPVQVAVHFAHRVWAAMVLIAAGWVVVAVRRLAGGERKLTGPVKAIAVLLLAQVALGAATIWSVRHPEVATAHQTLGAIVLATAALLTYRLQHLVMLAGSLAVGPAVPAAGRPRASGIPAREHDDTVTPGDVRWPAQPALRAAAQGGRA